MISLPLMQQVLKTDLVQYDKEQNVVQYYCECQTPKKKNDSIWISVNIYEFAHLCKLWAIKLPIPYTIKSETKPNLIGYAEATNMNKNSIDFVAIENSEETAIINVCEYLLKEFK